MSEQSRRLGVERCQAEVMTARSLGAQPSCDVSETSGAKINIASIKSVTTVTTITVEITVLGEVRSNRCIGYQRRFLATFDLRAPATSVSVRQNLAPAIRSAAKNTKTSEGAIR